MSRLYWAALAAVLAAPGVAAARNLVASRELLQTTYQYNTFTIQLQANNNCLDSGGFGGQTHVEGCNGGAYQQWQAKPNGPAGYYNLINVATGYCLDDLYASTSYGNTVDTTGCNGNAAQLWKLPPPGVYGNLNLGTNPSFCLDGGGNGGTMAQLWGCNTGAGNQWLVLLVDAATASLPTVGSVPISYFQNYQGTGVANAPYDINFSAGQVFNDGTSYFIGTMAKPTEQGNVFTIPVTGGVGPCPNGQNRAGTLLLTCGAPSTTFSVSENPMCYYTMSYSTTQACPPGSAFPPPPPPHSPPPPPPKVYDSQVDTTTSTASGGGQQRTEHYSVANPKPGGAPIAVVSTEESSATTHVHHNVEATSTTATGREGSGKGHLLNKHTVNTASEGGAEHTLRAEFTAVNAETGLPWAASQHSAPNVHVHGTGAGAHGGVSTTTTTSDSTGSETTFVTTSTDSQKRAGSGAGHVLGTREAVHATGTVHEQVGAHYTTAHLPGGTQTTQNVVVGGPNGPHVRNEGATTSSTETTATVNVNTFVTTSTSEQSQVGTGNGRVVGKTVTTTSSDQKHPVTSIVHNSPPPSQEPIYMGAATDLIGVSTQNHASTTETAAAGPAPPVVEHTSSEGSGDAPLCPAGSSMALYDTAKNLCLNVIGNAAGGVFTVSTTAKHVVNTDLCAPGSQAQTFTYTAASGLFIHMATGLALSVENGTPGDGDKLTLAPQSPTAAVQQWHWFTPATGGTIVSMADPRFSITDARAVAGAPSGPPAELWHLRASEPSGVPNANWQAQCSA